MKLHFHPASTTSRAVMLFCAESGIEYEPVVVDILTGEHTRDPYLTFNPNAQVPVLEDDDLKLTESSTIIKYLADKHELKTYPKELKARARVNERMDWFNTNYYREWAYHLIYPQVFPHHVREPAEVQAATLEWGRKHSEHWLGLIDTFILGDQKYVCGDDLTIADYFAAEVVGVGDLIRVDLSKFKNLDRWMKTMKALPHWNEVNEVAQGFADSLKEKDFVTIA